MLVKKIYPHVTLECQNSLRILVMCQICLKRSHQVYRTGSTNMRMGQKNDIISQSIFLKKIALTNGPSPHTQQWGFT